MRLQPELQKILIWTNSFLDLIFGIQLDRLHWKLNASDSDQMNPFKTRLFSCLLFEEN